MYVVSCTIPRHLKQELISELKKDWDDALREDPGSLPKFHIDFEELEFPYAATDDERHRDIVRITAEDKKIASAVEDLLLFLKIDHRDLNISAVSDRPAFYPNTIQRQKVFFVPIIIFYKNGHEYRAVGTKVNWTGMILPGQTLREAIAHELQKRIGYIGNFDFAFVTFNKTVEDENGNKDYCYTVRVTLKDTVSADIEYVEDRDLMGLGWELQDYLDKFEGLGKLKGILFYTEVGYDSAALIAQTSTGDFLVEWGDEGDMGVKQYGPESAQLDEKKNIRIGMLDGENKIMTDGPFADVHAIEFIQKNQLDEYNPFKYWNKNARRLNVMVVMRLKDFKIHPVT